MALCKKLCPVGVMIHSKANCSSGFTPELASYLIAEREKRSDEENQRSRAKSRWVKLMTESKAHPISRNPTYSTTATAEEREERQAPVMKPIENMRGKRVKPEMVQCLTRGRHQKSREPEPSYFCIHLRNSNYVRYLEHISVPWTSPRPPKRGEHINLT